MKKSPIIVLIAALLLAAGSASTAKEEASADQMRISPALDVLASELALTKTGLVGGEIDFTASDFEKTLGVSSLDSITILTLPDAECGTLYLATTPVMVGQVISRESIASLRFVPVDKKESGCSFVFGTVSSSQPLAVTCQLYLINSLNFAPSSDQTQASVSTIANIPVYGKLNVADPENDLLHYRIISYPTSGTLRLNDRQTGSYCYTPIDGFVGEDSFTYVAVDCYGNESDEQVMRLTVEEAGSVLTYCDMEGNSALLPAMRLAEKGVMIGETIGASAYFHPEQEVTRAEFLAMALCAAGVDVGDSNTQTSFADDLDIPEYLRKYVSYAADKRYIEGESIESGVYFYPDETVNYADAAVMLKNILGLTASMSQSVFSEDAHLSAAAQNAVQAVAEAGLFPDTLFTADSAVTRADAACMLAGVLEMK